MSSRSRCARPAFTLVELLVVIAIIGVLVALLLPAVQAAREAARRSSCQNNLKQLALGMHNFHDTNGVFPKNRYAGAEVGWQGYECFSASYKILPFIEQGPLYEMFDTSKGWSYNYNGPMNVKVKTFICPSSTPAPARSSVSWGGPGSNYGWCTGSSIYANGTTRTNANGMFIVTDEQKMADVTDGLSNTLMVSEFLSGSGATSGSGKFPNDIFFTTDSLFDSIANKNFPTQAEIEQIGNSAKSSPTGVRGNNGANWAWYASSQSSFNTAAPPNWRYPSAGGNCCPGGAHDWGRGLIPPRAMHPGGVNGGMGDGSVRFFPATIDLTVFQRIGNKSDGIPVELP